MGDFLGKTKVSIHRWEHGQFAPDEVTLGVLHKLWLEVFGEYEGPYENMYEAQAGHAAPSTQVEPGKLSTMAKALLIGGVAFFLAKGLMIDDED